MSVSGIGGCRLLRRAGGQRRIAPARRPLLSSARPRGRLRARARRRKGAAPRSPQQPEPPSTRWSDGTASRATTRGRTAGLALDEARQQIDRRPTRTSGRRSSGSFAPARCRPPVCRGPTPPPSRASSRRSRRELDRAAALQPEARPARRAPVEPDRIRQCDSRSPGTRDRHPCDAAGRQLRSGVRQHRGRAVGLARAARSLPLGGAQDQPTRRRTPDDAGFGDLPAREELVPGRADERGLPFGSSGGDRRSVRISRSTASTASGSSSRRNLRLHPGTRQPARPRRPAGRRAHQAIHLGGPEHGAAAAGRVCRQHPRRRTVGGLRAPGGRGPGSPVSGHRRPAIVGVVVREAIIAWQPEGVRQPAQVGNSLAQNERIDGSPACGSVTISGPFVVARKRRQRRAGAGSSSAGQPRARRRRLREEDSLDARPPRVSPAGHRGGSRDAARLLPRRPQRGKLRGRHPARARAPARAALSSCSASSSDPAGGARPTAYRISDLDLASRLSFFLWSSIPDDELLDAGGARPAARSGRARAAGAADAGRPPVDRAGGELRQSVARRPQRPRASRPIRTCFPSSTRTCARRCSGRRSCSSSTSSARTAACWSS